MSLYFPPGNGSVINPHPNSVTSDHPAHPSNMPTAADHAQLAQELHQRQLNAFSWMPPTHTIIDLRQR